MRLDQQNVCSFWLNFKELCLWFFVNFYVQQETEGAHYLIDFAIRPTSIIFSPNNSVGEDVGYCFGMESEIAS